MVKQCKICGNTFPTNDFPVRGIKVDGSPSYRSLCKACWRDVHKKHNRDYYDRYCRKESNQKINQDTDLLIKALAELARNSTELLATISKDDFVSYTGYTESFSFSDLVKQTYEYFDSIGVGNPSSTVFTDDGNYLVIGDTYGMRTRSGMFSLINQLVRVYNVSNVIVIGRQLDDNDNISKEFSNINAHINFIPTADELTKIHKLNEKIGGSIYRDFIKVGDVTIRNQEQISPYVKTSIQSLDPILFRGNTVVNCTRMEYATRSSKTSTNFIASCGALAEPHVPKVINKLLLKNGGTVKQVYHHSFRKYRKAEEDKRLWQKGCILLSKKGSVVIPNMLPIKQIDGVYTTACSGLVVSENGYEKTDNVSVVVSDIHAPRYNQKALNTVLVYIDFLSDIHNVDVFLAGDILNAESINPHILKRGEIPTVSVVDEFVSYNNVLSSFKAVMSDEGTLYSILGNHSDFINRWCKKNLQFKSLFDSILNSIHSEYDCSVVDVDDYTVTDNNTAILHGNTDIAVTGSSNVEKLARSFGESICGHSHSTCMRFGALRIGCLAQRNQGYNSPYNNWDNSIGVITSHKGVDFVSFMYITPEQEPTCYMTDGIMWYKTSDNSVKYIHESTKFNVELCGLL